MDRFEVPATARTPAVSFDFVRHRPRVPPAPGQSVHEGLLFRFRHDGLLLLTLLDRSLVPLVRKGLLEN